jgi:hypothetical protein
MAGLTDHSSVYRYLFQQLHKHQPGRLRKAAALDKSQIQTWPR